jgi:CHASE2 domain-containing sensor protein
VLVVVLVLIARERISTGSWGVTLAFLSRSGRRAFVVLWATGFVAVCAAYGSALAGNGGVDLASTIGGLVTAGLLALVVTDMVFGGAMVAADAAGRRRRRSNR